MSLLLLLSACSAGPPGEEGEPGEAEAPVDRRVLVEAEAATIGEVADHLVTTGLLESEAQADIVPEASGRVSQVLVEEGDAVRKGDVLAVLSSPSLEASAERALLELERARREVETARSLAARGAISDAELRAAESAFQVAQTTGQEASRTRGFTRLTSPIDGVVSAREVRVGEIAGGRRAFQVVDPRRTRVVVRLPEKDLARVRVGQPVQLQGAYDEHARAAGRVLRVSPVVDQQSGTVRVTIAVDPQGSALLPGQFVKVRIEVDRHRNVLTIPRRALVWIDGEPVAWKVVDGQPEAEKEKVKDEPPPEGLARVFARFSKPPDAAAPSPPPTWPLRQAERADLRIGYQDPQRVEVVEGLSAGDLVVTVGNQNLRNGTPLRLPGDPLPAKAAPPPEAGADAAPDDAP